MLNSRLIPTLLISEGDLYKTINFKSPKYVGDPLNTVRIFNEKEVDELIILDISSTKNNKEPDWDLISHISRECRMPLCYGGGLNSLERIEKLISLGVEKAAIGYAAFNNPEIIQQAIKRVGRQSIVGILDVKKTGINRQYKTMVLNGSLKTNMNAIEYAKYLEKIGVGEILLQNIDLDGLMNGFDINLIDHIYNNIDVPLTILGGAGSFEDIRKLVQKFKLIGVAAGSFFIFKGKHRAVLINYPDAKQKDKVLKNINFDKDLK